MRWPRMVGAACLSLGFVTGAAPERPADDAPVVLGLDHVPIAVGSLEAAVERYHSLGFTLKPGRPHDNGIRNQHVKFADGTELELITAPEARDALTATYRRHLAHGDGPALLALHAPSMEAAAARLDKSRTGYRRHGLYLDFRDREGLGHLFLGPRNRSPTDRPEHFVHANGASSLITVWLAGDDLSRERRLMETLGARLAPAAVRVPELASMPVARFAEGEVVFLPGDRQLVRGRRIVGATLRVRRLAVVQALLARRDVPIASHFAVGPQGQSIFLAPTVAHGLWLEFRESPAEPDVR